MEDEKLEEQEECDGPLVYRVLTKEEVEEARQELKYWHKCFNELWEKEQQEKAQAKSDK